MMKRTYFYVAFLGIFLLYTAHSGGPQTGKTGAPGENLCTQCHSPGNPQGLNGNVSINGLPATIIGGNTYSISIIVSNPNGISQGAGFQMTALDQNNQQAGTLSSPSSGSRVHSGGGRQYHDHTSRRAYSGGSATWSVQWTAPMFPTDTDVTMYAAGNITDMNPGVNTANDLIVTSNVTGTVLGSGFPLAVEVINSSDVSCFDGMDGTATASASGGAGGYTYAWSNGKGGPVVTSLSAGTYTVTVTDINSDQATDQVVILQPPSPTNINILAQENVSCFEGNDGSLQVQAAGNNGGFSYNWSNGQSGPAIFNLQAGSYTVTATDIKNCQESSTIDITEPDEIETDLTTVNANCLSDSSGIAQISVSGGSPPFTFIWSNGYQNNGVNSDQNTLTPDDYSVQITDMNGCQSNVAFTISKDSGIELALVDSTDNLCHGDSNGMLEIEVLSGQAPFEILWNTGDTTKQIVGLASGNYTAVVTDAIGCIDSLDVEIQEPDELLFNIEGAISLDCPGDSTSIMYWISGGSWNGTPPDTTELTTGTGMIIVSVVDSNACELSDTITIIHLDTLPPSLVQIQDSFYLDNLGMAQVEAEDMVSISDNCNIDDVQISRSTFDCGDIGLASVVISAQDRAGLITMDTFNLRVIDTISPKFECISDTITNSCSFSYELPIIEENCDSFLFTSLMGPLPGEEFPAGTSAVSFEISDPSGNTRVCSFTVTVDNDLIIQDTLEEEAQCFGESSIYSVEGLGGEGPLILVVGNDTFNGPFPILIQVDQITTVTLLDTTGCFAKIELGPDLTQVVVDSVVVTQMTSQGANDGTLEVFVSGGVGGYEYTWRDDQMSIVGTSSMVSGLSPGDYSCTVVDSNMCEITSDTFTIEMLTHVSTSFGNQLSVFPNPVNQWLTITSSNIKVNEVKLISSKGNEKQELRGHRKDLTLDLSQELPGMYFVVITLDNGETKVQKVIKN